MAAGSWSLYGGALESLAKGLIDLSSDTLKCVLCTSSYVPSHAHTVLADVVADECADADYGRVSLGSVTVTRVGANVVLDCADIDFGAAVTITAKYAILYDDTPSSPADPLIAYLDLNSGGGSVSSAAGSFKITIHANGVFALQA